MRALGALALFFCLAFISMPVAHARRYDELGRLEKESVDEALATRGLVLDPAPDGKIIGRVHVVNQDVFSERDGFFQWLNVFHRTTREEIIRRESLLGPGDRYDQAVVDETTRNLQEPFLTSLAVVLPVKAPKPDQVDLLIVSRDVWSLRFNTDFEYQDGTLVALATSVSENNLFGWRKRLSIGLEMDQGTVAVGPTYLDPNVAGTRMIFRTSVRALFGREGGRSEGSSLRTVLSYPLYSLASRWGASVDVTHATGVSRQFLGTEIRQVQLSTTPPSVVPWVYRVQRFGVQTAVARSFGRRVIQRVTGGHDVSSVRPSFTDDFPDDPSARLLFAENYFPRSERLSSLFVRYDIFTPRYRTYRDLNTFDLSEDVRLGPSAAASMSRAIGFLGSERDYVGLGVSGGWAFALGNGYQSVSAAWGGRFDGGALGDQTYSAGGFVATPVIRRLFRVMASAAVTVILDDSQNRLLFLGGTSGLRAYAIGDLFGTTSALAHMEVRSMALPIWSLRLGGLVFCDVGDAASPEIAGGGGDLARVFRSVLALHPHYDLGVGLRLLIPQLQPEVIRVDWAFATVSTPHTRAGWPGRVSIGFRQAF